MASLSKFSYHRLRYAREFDDEEAEEMGGFRNTSNWYNYKLRNFSFRKRPKLRIPGLRRFLMRKRSRFLSRVRVSWRKAWKRLKNGQAHMNDLFGGNYLLMQLSPATTTTLKSRLRPVMGCGRIHYHTLPLKYLPQKIS